MVGNPIHLFVRPHPRLLAVELPHGAFNHEIGENAQVYGLGLWEQTLEELIAREMRDQVLVKLVAEVRCKLEGDRPGSLGFTPDEAWLEDNRGELGARGEQEGLCLQLHLDVGLQHRGDGRSCGEEDEAASFLGEPTGRVVMFSDELASITIFSLQGLIIGDILPC